jgi:predicted membrane protein DUF2254
MAGNGDPKRAAVIPSATIVLALALLYAVSTTIDHAAMLGELSAQGTRTLLAVIFQPDAKEARDVLNTIGQALPGMLGIVITVVALVVELASNRYTGQVTKLFIRDRVSACVFALFVIASVYPLWVASSYDGAFVPRTGFYVSLLLASIALLILLPYFVYVFTFVQPPHIIQAIKREVKRSIARARSEDSASRMTAIKESVGTSIDQLADLAMNSIAHRDRTLATDAIAAAHGIMFEYFAEKPQLGPRWFTISEEERTSNPDYVTLAKDGISELVADRVWLEHKVMKQLSMVFVEALNNLRDANILIAMFLKDVALEALRLGDHPAHRLALRYFNTSLRSALAARDVRTAYNILYQYRGVVEVLIRERQDADVETVFGWFKYYGLLFESAGLGFIMETVAHDLYRLLRLALDAKSTNLEKLLSIFLEVDRPPDMGASDVHLRGVRKAQSMFAAYCLASGRMDLADRIAADMRNEPRDRLQSIRDELNAAEPRFWEITDRGVNFDYVEPELKPRIEAFFERSISRK